MSSGSKRSKSGSNGRVRREDISSPCDIQGKIKWFFMILHVAARPFEHGKRGMSFIEMAYLGLQTERSQQPPAADTKNDLLLQPHLGVAAIKLTGDAAMRCGIREIVGVEQIELRSPNRHFPAAKPDLRSGQLNLKPQPLAIWPPQRPDGQLAWIVDRIERLLPSFRIEVLTEISLTIKQADSDHRNTQVAGRFHLVAGYIAEAARVNRQRFAQHELHAEIGDRRERGVWVLLLKPCVRGVGLPVLAQQIVQTLMKRPAPPGQL